LTKKIKNKDYLILFGGAKINKRQGNCVGLGMILGIVGICISFFLIDNQLLRKSVVIIFAIVGYLVGCKFFKKEN